jgi:hypothetical protein
MAFCHYDSGGSHGYAVFEDGRRTRTRLQTSGLPDVPALQESGTPLAFEQRWLGARHYVAAEATASADARRMVFLGDREVVVPARDLTGRMLQDGLDALFGVCPWETLLTPTYRFFRLGPERPAAGEPAISRARSDRGQQAALVAVPLSNRARGGAKPPGDSSAGRAPGAAAP